MSNDSVNVHLGEIAVVIKCALWLNLGSSTIHVSWGNWWTQFGVSLMWDMHIWTTPHRVDQGIIFLRIASQFAMHFFMTVTAIQNILCVAVSFHRSVQNFIWNIYPSAEIANQIWRRKIIPCRYGYWWVILLQWKLGITRSLGPRNFVHYIRCFVISVVNNNTKQRKLSHWYQINLLYQVFFVISDLFISSFHCSW